MAAALNRPLTRLYQKGILTGVLAVAFAASLIWAFVENRRYNKEKDSKQLAIQQNSSLIQRANNAKRAADSLMLANRKLDSTIKVLLQDRAKSKDNVAAITSKYSKVYAQINSTTASQQFVLLDDLLTKHERLPVKRN